MNAILLTLGSETNGLFPTYDVVHESQGTALALLNVNGVGNEITNVDS